MTKQYSIAEARHHLASIVHELEQMPFVELTRRHKTVAVLISLAEFNRLRVKEQGFFDAFSEFRTKHDLTTLAIEPKTFADLRDRSPGRASKK